MVLINKTDLKKKLELPKNVFFSNPVLINAKAGKIQALEQQMEQILTTDLEKIHSPYPFLSQG